MIFRKIGKVVRNPMLAFVAINMAYRFLYNRLIERKLSFFRNFKIGSRAVFNKPLVCDGTGVVLVGNNVSFGVREAPGLGEAHVRLQARGKGAVITVGNDVMFSNNIYICARKSVTIASRCLIGDGVMIVDSDFHPLDPEHRRENPTTDAPVILEENVWVGSRAIILKGVVIGRDSIVAAGAVVSKSVPPRSVVAGNPAKIVKTL